MDILDYLNYLEHLPPEILNSILLKLPLDDLYNLCQVSTSLNLFCKNWSFWADKAYQDFKFPRSLFSETDLLNPLYRYKEVIKYIRNPISALLEAIIKKKLDLLAYILDDFIFKRSEINYIIYEAALNNNLDAIKYIYSKINVKMLNPNFILNGAAESKILNKNIINFAIHYGADDFGNALYKAGQYDNLNTLKYLIQLGAKSVVRSLLAAAENGNNDILNYLFEFTHFDIQDINEAFNLAILSDNTDTIDILINNGADDFNESLCTAASINNLKLFEYLLLKIHNLTTSQTTNINYTDILKCAVEGNSIKIVKYLIDEDLITSEDLYDALLYAITDGNAEMVKYILSTNQIRRNLLEAYEQSLFEYSQNKEDYQRKDIINYIKSKL